MSISKTAVAIVLLACGLPWLVSGCGGSADSKTGVQLYLADDPIDAQEVNVTISEVAVSKSGEGWIVLCDYTEDPITLNLLDYRYDGDPETADRYLLADSPLDEGHYTQIRLILTKVEIVDSLGVIHPCEMSSQDETGLKLVGGFDVAPGAKTAVLIDFNVAKSIVEMGNGTYRLQPVVKVVPLQISGTVHGIVQFKDGEGADVDVPAGVAISAYQGTTLCGTALINDDGSFGIDGLVAGDYTLKLETEGYTSSDTPITITAGYDLEVDPIIATAL